MLSKKIETAINEQINAEFYSAYLYLSMSSYFEDINLTGFANWMRIQYMEENAHALKLFDYVHERGGKVELKNIEHTPKTWKTPVEIFELTLEHERKVTSLIHDLVNLAIEEKDHATNNMLQWFVSEQVEEEATADEILNRLKMFEGKGPGLFMMDRELATRTFVDNTQN